MGSGKYGITHCGGHWEDLYCALKVSNAMLVLITVLKIM